MLNKIIKFFLENKLVTVLVLAVIIGWGIVTAPFNWETGFFPRDPVPVDAIPDLGENQQIVYTEWQGRSPQDIDDQITYPLTTALLGIPGVKDIRSNSIFGFSSIYIIFNEDVDFYWSRTRILEKLNSLPSGTLPEGVTPSLGPDATALGQIYWYTLEGRDKNDQLAGGWDPQELRTIQDFYVKYALTAVDGVAEVASIGGFVKEYQVNINPVAMKNFGADINMILKAVKNSNQDIGARTIEFNRVEYMVRSLGYIKSIEDLEMSVVVVHNNVPVRLKDVAVITEGPASRRGGLDKGGNEAVGGVVVARFGANPMQVINNVKAKIEEISTGLPEKKLSNGNLSKVKIVPFYDRSGLIKETIGTLESALFLEILISILVVIILVLNLRASLIISGLLPIGVLMSFIMMRSFGIDANIVALSGIAIAIGVMVDVGVVITENIIRHFKLPGVDIKRKIDVIYRATIEVVPAVITALITTIVSFLPVFAMENAEGKLFKPLAYTKTFAMLSALIIGVIIIPAISHIIFSAKTDKPKLRKYLNLGLIAIGVILIILFNSFLPAVIVILGINGYFEPIWPKNKRHYVRYINIAAALVFIVIMLTKEWMPLGAKVSSFSNLTFVIVLLALILGILAGVIYYYKRILKWALKNKWKFLSLPLIVIVFGIFAWLGAHRIFGFLPDSVKKSKVLRSMEKLFPGTGKEFMPSLDEGSFLLMPTTMPHSGVQENQEMIKLLDSRVNSIPEVESIVGKWGRVNSALDPAPISMYENVINYKPEYIQDENGNRIRFKVNDMGDFILKNGGTVKSIGESTITAKELIPDKNGEYFRQWRDNIKSPDDIWKEIAKKTNIPGLTSAPKLQPIQTRLIMLQTGMRAPMGIKVYGNNLDSIEKAGLILEEQLKKIKGVNPTTVFAERVVGKPYLEININRKAIARYGLSIKHMQTYISGAIGGLNMTTTVEGRERFAVRIRYPRELRDNPENIGNVLIPTSTGVQVPLSELVEITYTKGPQVIKSENTFLVGYVIFDKEKKFAETDVVDNALKYLNNKIKHGEISLPQGTTFKFTGNYENQVRATKRLLIVIPISLIIIFLILYFQFRSIITSSLVFTGIFVAFAGGFIMIWLYGQGWFLNFSIAGMNIRDLFQVHTINLSVAVWVGFIALFGVATDDGVLIGTYLKQIFALEKPNNIEAVRASVIKAGSKRVRPAVMTTATTIIALIPVLTSTGKGSDIMVPMAIPLFGGMIIQVMTMFIVPVLYSMWKEKNLKKLKTDDHENI